MTGDASINVIMIMSAKNFVKLSQYSFIIYILNCTLQSFLFDQ